MSAIHLVAALALLQYLLFGALVGKARGQYGVKAPAVTGHEGFERMYRVQMNTLELLVAFLPALGLAGLYWSPVAVATLPLRSASCWSEPSLKTLSEARLTWVRLVTLAS